MSASACAGLVALVISAATRQPLAVGLSQHCSGEWGELEYWGAPPLGTAPVGSSPAGPALHAVWQRPPARLAKWRRGRARH